MEDCKKRQIQELVDQSMKGFAEKLEKKHSKEVHKSDGVINSKKKNVFISQLDSQFMFYSAFVRSFDSSFGNLLEKLGNDIAKLSYVVKGDINSYLLPSQENKINELIEFYTTRSGKVPEVKDYSEETFMPYKNVESFRRTHVTDHYFYNKDKDEHYLIELKAGGNLDTKKAPAEKKQLLTEYYMLKNLLDKTNPNIKIFFGAAYNKDGEDNDWNQASVRACFANEELLIGKAYWNFVCNDEFGFEVVMEQYRISVKYIREAIEKIKHIYFPDEMKAEIEELLSVA